LARGVQRLSNVVCRLCGGHDSEATLDPTAHLASKPAVGGLLSSVHLDKVMSSSPTPLLDADMTGIAYDVPHGITGPPPTAMVHLTLSDGTVQSVGQSEDFLSLLWKMRGARSWFMYASEDVVCVSVAGVKMLVMETSLINQRLLNLYAPIYTGGKVR